MMRIVWQPIFQHSVLIIVSDIDIDIGIESDTVELINRIIIDTLDAGVNGSFRSLSAQPFYHRSPALETNYLEFERFVP